MNLTYFQQLSFALLVLAGLIGCKSPAPEGPPEVIDTVFVSPPGDSPAAVAVNPHSGYVYVVNSNDFVSILKDEQVAAALPVGDQAGPAIAVDEKQDRVYVVNEYDDTVTLIANTKVMTTLTVAGRFPTSVAVDSTRGLAYVVSGYRIYPPHPSRKVVAGSLTAIAQDQVIDSISLGKALTTLVAVDAQNGYVYLGSVNYVGSDGGYVIVVKNMQEVGRYNMQSTIASMDVDPRTGDVYALYHTTDQLSRFSQGKLVDSIAVQEGNMWLKEVRVHPTTGAVYVLDSIRRELVVVQDMAVIDRVTVDWQPEAMAIDPLTGNVYVTGVRFDTVTVVQGTQVLTTIPVGWNPYGLGINPVNGRVYVTNTTEDSVTILGFE